MRKSLIVVLIATLPFWFASCVYKKQLLYFQNLHANTDTAKSAISDSSVNLIIIQPYDLLDIRIKTTEKALEAILENQTSGSSMVGGSQVGGSQSYQQQSLGTSSYLTSYLVDARGNIRLPLVGEITIQGLTIRQARNKIKESMQQWMKDPYVDIKFLTFRVTVFGEVNHPGVFTVSNEKADLLDVLAMAGDLNDNGQRTNVKIIRGDPRNPKIYEMDLRDTRTFNSPGFILQPNDIVYVEPFPRKFLFANLNEILPLLTVVNAALVIVELISLAKAGHL